MGLVCYPLSISTKKTTKSLTKILFIMKLLQSICLVFCFLTLQNEAFAIIHKNTDNIFSSQKTALIKKPTLLQRYIAKRIGIKQDTTINQNALTEQSQGDKLANISLGSTIGGVALTTIMTLSGGEGLIAAILILTGAIALLVGLILAIVALTSKDLTPQGKKRAKGVFWAITIFFALLIWLWYKISGGD